MQPLQRPTRPKKCLVLLLIVLALHQIVGVVRMLTLPSQLAENISLWPVFEGVGGMVWALVLVAAAISVSRPVSPQWTRSFATTRRVAVLLTIFALYQMLRLVLFAQADYDRQRLPFLVMVGLVWLLVWCAVEFSIAVRTRLLQRETFYTLERMN